MEAGEYVQNHFLFLLVQPIDFFFSFVVLLPILSGKLLAKNFDLEISPL